MKPTLLLSEKLTRKSALEMISFSLSTVTKLNVVLLLVFIPGLAFSQDPYFSQFYANRVYLNPAYAGFDPGTTVTVNYRNQWYGIPDGAATATNGSFQTYNITADIQAPCLLELEDVNFGMAVSAFKDDAGSMPLVTQGFGLALSHEQPLIRGTRKSKLHRLDVRVGSQLSMIQRSLNGDHFIFSNQLDHVVGLIDNPATLKLNSALFPNINTGVLVRGYHQHDKHHNTLFTVGVNFSNVNRPNYSLRNSTSAVLLPMRTTIHAGMTYLVTRYSGVKSPIYLAPQFRWDIQSDAKLNLQTIGTYLLSKGFYSGIFFQYNFPNERRNVPGNFLTRNTSTVILTTGFDVRSALDTGVPWRKRKSGIVLGLSYDINVAGLTSVNTLGVLELNLKMNFQREKPKNCAELGKFELYRGGCPVRF
jgi:type IX secretion system PorP/SprF family membrane protein